MEKRAETICDLLDEIYALAHVMRLLFEIKEDAEIRVNPHAPFLSMWVAQVCLNV